MRKPQICEMPGDEFDRTAEEISAECLHESNQHTSFAGGGGPLPALEQLASDRSRTARRSASRRKAAPDLGSGPSLN